MLIAEADGSAAEAHRLRAELTEILGEAAHDRPRARGPRRDRGAVALAGRRLARVAAQRGGNVSEDIVVPVERL